MKEHQIRFSGRRYPARLIAKKKSGPVDIALFFVDGQEFPQTFRIATESPASGEPAWIVGYPRGRNSYRRTDGEIQTTRVVGYEYEFNRPAIKGESGGPLFVKHHQVVGIVTHRDRRSTLVTTLPQIRRFLTSAIGGIPNCSKPKAPPPPREESPKPKEPPVKASPGTVELLMRIEVLENEIERLRNDFAKLAKQKGPKGERGPQGEIGPAGIITVIHIDVDGKETKREPAVLSGSEVRLYEKTFLIEEK